MPFRIKNGLYYGWIIVIVYLVIQAVMMGVNSSFTVFFKPIEAEYGLTRTTTSAISSLSMALIPLSGFAGGWALDRYGPRIVLFFMGLLTGLSLVLSSQTNAVWQLFLTYGVLLAVGMGAIYVVATSTVSRWFDKKRGLAVGIAGSGEGVGTVLIAPLSAFLISRFSWKTAYLIIGLITWAVVMPLSRLLKKDPQEIGLLPDGIRPDAAGTVSGDRPTGVPSPRDLTLVEILKTRSFWCVVGIWLFFSFGMMMLLTHIVPHVTDYGVQPEDAALIVGIMGAARVVGMVGLGSVADRFGRKRVAVASTLVQAGAMFSLVWLRDPWMFFLFAVAYGLGNGGLFSGVTSQLGDTFGLSRLGAVLGLLEIGWGTGAAVGPLVGGLFYDTYGSYSGAFIMGAAAMVVIVFLVTGLRPETKRQQLEVSR
jgi:OFA family oxalate/formate antiporter-like MFS transporter